MDKLAKAKQELISDLVFKDSNSFAEYYDDLQNESLDVLNGWAMKQNYIHCLAATIAGMCMAHAVATGYPKDRIMTYVKSVMDASLAARKDQAELHDGNIRDSGDLLSD